VVYLQTICAYRDSESSAAASGTLNWQLEHSCRLFCLLTSRLTILLYELKVLLDSPFPFVGFDLLKYLSHASPTEYNTFPFRGLQKAKITGRL
jgi:hypothetical protein